jgi:hypothetical protein
MNRIRFAERWWPVFVACALVGIAAGVALTLARAGAGLPVPGPGDSTTNPLIGEPGSALESVISGSTEVQFPPYLSGLDVSPTDIAVDASGDLWLVGISSGGELSLLHGSPSDSGPESYAIKADSPGLSPRLEIDQEDHLLIAAGEQVIRVQRDTLEYETFPIPPSDSLDPDAETRTAMEMRLQGGSVFLSGRSANSIIQLVLDSGKAEEIEITGSFGGYDDFLVSRASGS